jgi:hypothetical protein
LQGLRSFIHGADRSEAGCSGAALDARFPNNNSYIYRVISDGFAKCFPTGKLEYVHQLRQIAGDRHQRASVWKRSSVTS